VAAGLGADVAVGGEVGGVRGSPFVTATSWVLSTVVAEVENKDGIVEALLCPDKGSASVGVS
jgi:hypothetical protein